MKRDEKFWLSTLDNANCKALDTKNRKLYYHYADLINMDKFLKTGKKAGEKKKEKKKIRPKTNREKKPKK